jgi:hypothetical protein
LTVAFAHQHAGLTDEQVGEAPDVDRPLGIVGGQLPEDRDGATVRSVRLLEALLLEEQP